MSLQDHYLYPLALEWTRGRSGVLRAETLAPLDVSAPPEFSGEAGAWTPEHLLVAATASCLMTTFLAIAEVSKLKVSSYRMKACGKLEKVPEEGYRFTEISLTPIVDVAAGDVDRARRLMAKAEKSCFVSKSLRARVQVEPEFVHAPAEVTS